MESDGINEALEGAIRVAVTAGARAGELLARAREAQLRRAAAAEEHHAREVTQRLRAEQAATRAELAPVHRQDWWDRTTPDDIQRAYTAARAWAGTEPDADRAVDRILEEVRNRYGVDVNNTGADPAAVRAALARAEAERATADRKRTGAESEAAEAHHLIAEADRADQATETARAAAEHEPDPAVREEAAVQAEREQARAPAAREAGKDDYDSAERRQAFAADLERRGIDQETIAARMTADVSHGTHPSEVVKATSKQAPKARKSRGSKQRQHELSR